MLFYVVSLFSNFPFAVIITINLVGQEGRFFRTVPLAPTFHYHLTQWCIDVWFTSFGYSLISMRCGYFAISSSIEGYSSNKLRGINKQPTRAIMGITTAHVILWWSNKLELTKPREHITNNNGRGREDMITYYLVHLAVDVSGPELHDVWRRRHKVEFQVIHVMSDVRRPSFL